MDPTTSERKQRVSDHPQRSDPALSESVTSLSAHEEWLFHALEIEMTRISGLDSTIFTIKGWTITLTSALVGVAFTTAGGISGSKTPLLILAIVATAIFMLLDLHFRNVQSRHVAAAERIKSLLAGIIVRSASGDRTLSLWSHVWSDEPIRAGATSVRRAGLMYTWLLYLAIIGALIGIIASL